jgi:hypothetical protein
MLILWLTMLLTMSAHLCEIRLAELGQHTTEAPRLCQVPVCAVVTDITYSDLYAPPLHVEHHGRRSRLWYGSALWPGDWLGVSAILPWAVVPRDVVIRITYGAVDADLCASHAAPPPRE